MSRFETPVDPVALRMENRLLTIEVEHLRGLLRDASSPDGSGGAGPASGATEGDAESLRAQVDELRQARSDLRWLLTRLDASPAAPLLRRFGGYRTLTERWLQ